VNKKYIEDKKSIEEKYAKLVANATLFKTCKKPTKSMFHNRLDVSISAFNKEVNKHRQKCPTWAGHLPTINTKTRHTHGRVGELLEKGFDSILVSDNPNEKSISLCSHGSHTHVSCLCVTKETLMDMLNTYIKDSTMWSSNVVLYDHMTELFSKKTSLMNLIGYLSMKCPMMCRNDGSRCPNTIPLRTIWQNLSKLERKQFQKTQIISLIIAINCRDSNISPIYCTNNECICSNTGYFKKAIKTSIRQGGRRVACDDCHAFHKVHAHKTTCPGCSTNFCDRCKMSPYHEGEVCLGKNDTMGMNDQEYRQFIRENRKCPSCSVWTSKTMGCDHMNCPNCNTHWCWRCIQPLDQNDPYRHRCLTDLNGRQDGHYRDYGF